MVRLIGGHNRPLSGKREIQSGRMPYDGNTVCPPVAYGLQSGSGPAWQWRSSLAV